MILGCTMALDQGDVPVPFRSILAAWERAGFGRAGCREAVEQAIARAPALADLLAPDAIDRGEVVATPRLLYGLFEEERPWSWSIRGPTSVLRGDLAADEVPAVAAAIRAAVRVDDREQLAAELTRLLGADSVEDLLRHLTPPSPELGCWPAVDAPGIYRREHASVAIRSATTTVITDPQGLARGWTIDGSRYPGDETPARADAVVLTHSHQDHWHVPSILRAAAFDPALVLVPPVPRPSLLCPEDMRATLLHLGIAARAPAWGSTVTVGDIEIDVLPFYGEQPTREARLLPPDLRNWGSCYRFNTPDFSALILVDSGVDPEGSMLDVIRASVAARGPVDVLLSQLGVFPEAINPGLPHYAFTLPFDYLERVARDPRQRSMTLGPEGLTEACRIAGARWFLPYAQGFQGLGRDPTSGETGHRESEELQRFDVAPTCGVRWHPGDVAEIRGGRLTIRPVVSGTP